MRTAYLIASLGALALAGCGEREVGPPVQRSFPVGGFQSIALGGSAQVVVTVGGAPSVRAEGAQRDVERLEIRVEGNVLRIGEREKDGFLFFGRHGSEVTIHVTVPSLAAATIGGSGDIRIDRIEGESFNGSIGGSGELSVQRLRVGRAVFSVAGSGAIRASGEAQSAEIDLAGSGEIDVAGVAARQASVTLAGSGDIRARATESARVTLAGSGDVRVTGTANCRVSKRGSGEAHCGPA
ncbi:head GIN domain-containing protein [Allosphingosinicella sp.]|jgi:hypothetical protein|uniref:head GIN domain-containing protein n=1 Tax=Allosphingosinicella sp. TaxID=2823234 RepID=UPI002F055DCD